MEYKDGSSSRSTSSRRSRSSRDRDHASTTSDHDIHSSSQPSSFSSTDPSSSSTHTPSTHHNPSSLSSTKQTAVKEAVATVIVNERSKYESQIRESQGRLDKYTAENDRLLDEVSNLRIQIREMKNDRAELVRAHHESMSLLAQVSEEKLVEFKSKSEQEAAESKAAQEEALRTVLEMMEKDCEDRVAELDTELARVEQERERAMHLQVEAAAKAHAEETNKMEVEEACRLAVEKLVKERQVRSEEMLHREARERELEKELEETRERVEMEREAAVKAAAKAAAAEAAAAEGGGHGIMGNHINIGSGYGDYPRDDNSYNDGESYKSNDSAMSPLIDGKVIKSSRSRNPDKLKSGGVADLEPPPSKRPPITDRRSTNKHQDSIFLNDPLGGMTQGRRIALRLQNYRWYQPKGKVNKHTNAISGHWDVNGLGLQSAWAYFEHSILPRYIVRNADGSLPTVETEPTDEEKTRLSVYEGSEKGSSCHPDDSPKGGGKDDDSDVDDWLYKPKEKKRGPPGRRSGNKTNSRKGSSGGCCSKPAGDLQRAAPGEPNLPTRLYSPFFTPLSQMGDFGIGLGLYFSSLRGIFLITLLAGLINLPNMMYFGGTEYSAGQEGVEFLLRGSAICTEQVWVPCPTCTVSDFERARDRIAGATTVTPEGNLQILVFAKKNTCDGATMMVGIYNLASLGFILLATIALGLYQRRKQIQFDEGEQTAQDYSIEIFNPPADATEPEEWKEFFEGRFGGHVTCCTVTKDNDLLVRALAERREVLMKIEEKVREGTSISTLHLSELAAKVEHGRNFFGNLKSRISPGIPELVGRLTVLNAKIQGLAQQEYRATRVFCTFETENTQRQVLSEMAVGSMAAYKNKTHKVSANFLFRGEHVLLVREAEEPSSVRWTDLDEKLTTRIKQIAITTLISLLCICAVAVIVFLCRQRSAAASALAISVSNALFPQVAKIITNFETHASETGKQSSLFVKIAIFRWVITAIVITIIMPLTSTLTNGSEHLIQSIYIIFFADLVTTNAFQILDPLSNFQRHILAPRAASQERMNLLMSGTEYTVAERYTNMMKTLFLTFYYCAIYPSAFFMCALTLFVNFFTDKFSLMRTWKPAPMLGPYIAKFSSIYFMTTAIAAMAVSSSYMFSGFPFDNLCPEDTSHTAYYGNWKITDGNGEASLAMVEPGERSYHFCDQFLRAFPFLPEEQPDGSEWMTEEQEQLTGIYGWVSVSVLGLLGLIFLYRLLRAVLDIFTWKYQPDGKDKGVPFSQADNTSCYVPQVESNYYTHPLVAANIDYISENLFDWNDPDRSHSYYDLTRDAEQLLKGNEEICHNAFGQIRHWPPGRTNQEESTMNKTTKSALKKSKESNMKRNVSWSSKVTCKTYSKDDPNAYNFFNANASTSEGMNFDGHADPIYDPHTQNEARSNKDKSSNNSNGADFDPYYSPGMQYEDDNAHVQGENSGQRTKPSVAEQFDPYYNSNLDYANQMPDHYSGQHHQDAEPRQGDGMSWGEGSDERSYENSSSGVGSVGHSEGSFMGNSNGSSFSQNQNINAGAPQDAGFQEEHENEAFRGSNVVSGGSNEYTSTQHSVSIDGAGSERSWGDDDDGTNGSGSAFNNSGSQQNYYDAQHSGSGFDNSGSEQNYYEQGSQHSGSEFDNSGSQQNYYGGSFHSGSDYTSNSGSQHNYYEGSQHSGSDYNLAGSQKNQNDGSHQSGSQNYFEQKNDDVQNSYEENNDGQNSYEENEYEQNEYESDEYEGDEYQHEQDEQNWEEDDQQDRGSFSEEEDSGSDDYSAGSSEGLLT